MVVALMAESSRRSSSRRKRRTEAETRQLALQTAVQEIREHGLAVGLEYLNMEDVIRESGVSRTAFYRLWPVKDQFIGDLVVELAKDAIPTQNTRGRDATEMLRSALLSRINEMSQAESRWNLALELIVEASVSDLGQSASLTSQWRTYFALVAAVMSMPEGEVKDAALGLIDNSEEAYRHRLVGNFDLMATLFGLRLRESFGLRLRESSEATLEDVADLVIATTRGLVLRGQLSLAQPGHDLVGLSYVAILNQCFEDDPGVVWDQQRIGELRSLLTDYSDLFVTSDESEGQGNLSSGLQS